MDTKHTEQNDKKNIHDMMSHCLNLSPGLLQCSRIDSNSNNTSFTYNIINGNEAAIRRFLAFWLKIFKQNNIISIGSYSNGKYELDISVPLEKIKPIIQKIYIEEIKLQRQEIKQVESIDSKLTDEQLAQLLQWQELHPEDSKRTLQLNGKEVLQLQEAMQEQYNQFKP